MMDQSVERLQERPREGVEDYSQTIVTGEMKKERGGKEVQRSWQGYRVGEGHQRAKLTDAQVVEIRRKHRAGESLAKIARCFGVGRTTVWKIVHLHTRSNGMEVFDVFEPVEDDDFRFMPWPLQDKLKAAAAIKDEDERLATIDDVVARARQTYPNSFRWDV